MERSTPAQMIYDTSAPGRGRVTATASHLPQLGRRAGRTGLEGAPNNLAHRDKPVAPACAVRREFRHYAAPSPLSVVGASSAMGERASAEWQNAGQLPAPRPSAPRAAPCCSRRNSRRWASRSSPVSYSSPHAAMPWTMPRFHVSQTQSGWEYIEPVAEYSGETWSPARVFRHFADMPSPSAL